MVAIIGPQSSGIAHIFSHVSNQLHVPLISLATDPTLNSLQFPYLFQSAGNDAFQMNAVVDFITYQGWREVTTIYIDDDYGRSGATALSDAFSQVRARISYKMALPIGATEAEVTDLLVKVNAMESRVFVVHINPDSGLTLFSVAQRLGMVNAGYVWITTDWLSSVLDSSQPVDSKIMELIQGIITFRRHVQESTVTSRFREKWKNGSMNTYSLFAYDSVWLVARAIDEFLNQGSQIVFAADPMIRDAEGSNLRFSSLRAFHGGEKLLQIMMGISFRGLTGLVEFDQGKNLIHPVYDIINVIGTGTRIIGYWSKLSGLSTIAPELLERSMHNYSAIDQEKLYGIIWPGETMVKPRGWVFPNNGKLLAIGVPRRVSFGQFVSSDSGPDGAKGYVIDVFKAAINLLPYPVPYKFVFFGDGRENPSYNELVFKVAQNVSE